MANAATAQLFALLAGIGGFLIGTRDDPGVALDTAPDERVRASEVPSTRPTPSVIEELYRP